jgi:hypothetical protein
VAGRKGACLLRRGVEDAGMTVQPPAFSPEKQKARKSLAGRFSAGAGLLALLLALLAFALSQRADAADLLQALVQVVLVGAVAVLVGVMALVLSLIGLSQPGRERTPAALGLGLSLLSAAAIVAVGAALFPRASAFFAEEFFDNYELVVEPIPHHPEAGTWRTERAVFDRWYEATFTHALAQQVPADAPWRAQAEALVDAWIRHWQGELDAPGMLERRALADDLRQAGAEDPLILFLSALGEEEAYEKARLLGEALEKLEPSPYPRTIAFWSAVEWGQALLWDRQGWDAIEESDRRALVLLESALDQNEFPTGDGCVVIQSHLLVTWPETFFDRNAEEICALLERSPSVQEWAARLVRGQYYVNVAWDHRGSGWAHTVSREDRQNFQRYLSRAEKELTRAWELNPQHPRAPMRMIQVSMGNSPRPLADMRLWFDRAVSARFDFTPAYWQLEWGLRPRWHGSHELMLDFARRCAETERYDTDVPFQLIRIAVKVASEMRDPAGYLGQSQVREAVREVLQNYLTKTEDPVQLAYYQSHYAAWAHLVGERDESRQMLEQLNAPPHPRALAFWDLEEEALTQP